MGQDATATLSEIEAARRRLQRDVDVLDERVQPDDLRERARKMAAVAATGGLGLVVLAAVARRRLRHRAEHRHARVQAEALADALDDVRSRGRQPGEEPAPEEITSAIALVASLAALAATLLQAIGRRAARR